MIERMSLEVACIWGRQALHCAGEGNRAVVHSRLVVRYKPKNKVWTTEVLDLFKFQDGKIMELIEFADTAQIKDMMADG